MDNYRLLEHKDEILKMVKKAPTKAIGEIWQTLPVRREIYKITKVEVLTEAMIFHTTTDFEFEKDQPIYIKINYKNLIFKLMPDEFRSSKNQLSCIYPEKAKAIESRKIPRTKLPKKSNMHVTLRTFANEKYIDIKVTLEDVSEFGLGVKASVLNQEYFVDSNVFQIVKVCGRNFVEGAELSIRHIYEKEHKSFFGVGFAASIPFSERFYEILREEIKKERFKMTS